MRTHRANGGTWKRRRRQVMTRDGGFCQLRFSRCTGIATTLDHIIPVSRGGNDSLDNLRAACSSCNQAKGNSMPYGIKRGPCGRIMYTLRSQAEEAATTAHIVTYCWICPAFHLMAPT